MDQYTVRHLKSLAVGHLSSSGRQMSYFGHNPYDNSPTLMRHYSAVTSLGPRVAHIAEVQRLVRNM